MRLAAHQVSRAQKGDRVATLEFNPTDRRIHRINTGTVLKAGAHGADVLFDDPRLKGAMWVRDWQIHFIVSEGTSEHAPILDRHRPPKEKGTFASSIAKQQILPDPPKPAHEPKEPPNMAKPTDPLEALRASGVDLLDLWEALGKKIVPQAQDAYEKTVANVEVCRREKAAAEADVNRILGELRIAEQMAAEAKKSLVDAESAQIAAYTRLERARGDR